MELNLKEHPIDSSGGRVFPGENSDNVSVLSLIRRRLLTALNTNANRDGIDFDALKDYA